MIEINLLPPEARNRKKRIELPDISFLPVVAGFLSAIVIIQLLLGLTLVVKARTLRRLDRKWQAILPEKEKAGRMKAEFTGMKNRLGAINALLKNRRSWTRMLNDISDAMIPGVWLNKLWLEQRVVIKEPEVKSDAGEPDGKAKQPQKAEAKKIIIRTLHLAGSVIAGRGEETATIGKFIRSLKGSRYFFSDFSDIESASIQRTKLKEEEVMDFELICYYKNTAKR